MNYNKIIIYCDKYNINRYTPNGKPLTYNKLIHRVEQFESKKHKLSQTQKTYNSIFKYLKDEIDEHDLSKAMHHYIGN